MNNLFDIVSNDYICTYIALKAKRNSKQIFQRCLCTTDVDTFLAFIKYCKSRFTGYPVFGKAAQNFGNALLAF